MSLKIYVISSEALNIIQIFSSLTLKRQITFFEKLINEK